MLEQGKTGLEIRSEVMVDAFDERAMGNATAFTQPLQAFVNERAWGSGWAPEALPP
ncbi:carboxymuconolactone decarboxylase family protein, partial [Pseudomonas aeruginosa]